MRARLFPVLLAAGVPVFLVVFVTNIRAQIGSMFFVLVGLVGVWLWARRGGSAGEPAWAGPTTAALDGRRGSPVVALASVEGRELVLSPWFGAGTGLSVILLVLLGGLGGDDISGSWGQFIDDLSFAAHPLLGFIAVAVHFAVTRSRRHGCDELFTTFPIGRATRVVGHLGVVPVSVMLVLVYVIAFFTAVAVGNDHLYGPSTEGLLPALAACTVLAAGAVALGAATGRWLRWGIAPIAALVLIVMIGTWATSPQRWTGREALASANIGDDVERLFVETRSWLNVLWLAAMASVLASVALLGSRRWARASLGGAVAVAVIAALLIVQPMPEAKARASAALLTDPTAHHTCSTVESVVKVCAYEKYGDHTERVAEVLRPVVAAIPEDARRPVTFAQLPPEDTSTMPAEVMEALAGRAPARPDDVHDLGFGVGPGELRAAALRLAAITVGLPAEPDRRVARVVAGEARGVLVLWLGTRGLDPGAARRVATADPQAAHPTERGQVWPTGCGDGGALIWSAQDLEAARAIVGLSEGKVRAVVHEGWARWVDPTTTTDELLAALDIEPVGAPEPGIVAAEYSC